MEVAFAAFGAIRLAAFLFSSTRQVLKKRKGGGENAGGPGVAPGVSLQIDGGGDTASDMLGVGMELAMKSRNPFQSRKKTNQAITGLSTEFAAHRQEVRVALMQARKVGRCLACSFLSLILRSTF